MTGYRGGRQWMLLAVFVLALAVAGMHHVMQSGAHSAAGDGHVAMATVTTAESDHGEAPEPNSPHDFLHLCLAVLSAAAGLLLLAAAVLHPHRTRARAPGPPHRTRVLGGRDGPISPFGRQLLASTCVLRI
ncbi:hypothetical protein ACPZ19_26375 [Amycolatopsis lurida]